MIFLSVAGVIFLGFPLVFIVKHEKQNFKQTAPECKLRTETATTTKGTFWDVIVFLANGRHHVTK